MAARMRVRAMRVKGTAIAVVVLVVEDDEDDEDDEDGDEAAVEEADVNVVASGAGREDVGVAEGEVVDISKVVDEDSGIVVDVSNVLAGFGVGGVVGGTDSAAVSDTASGGSFPGPTPKPEKESEDVEGAAATAGGGAGGDVPAGLDAPFAFVEGVATLLSASVFVSS